MRSSYSARKKKLEERHRMGSQLTFLGKSIFNLKQANGKPLYMAHWLFQIFFFPEADTIMNLKSNTNILKIAIINSWPVFFKSVEATKDQD